MLEVSETRRDIIVIGASAGGLEALKQLVTNLPADLPAAVFVVIHFPAFATSYLPEILGRFGALPAAHAVDGEPIVAGRIYVAPIDNHLLVENGTVRVWHGPKENHTRPAIDPLFRSAAAAYGERVVGVVLSGTLRDGTAGLIAIKEKGGLSVTQDPHDALFPGMPENAIKYDHVDYSLTAVEIASLLGDLTGGQAVPVESNGKRDVKHDKSVKQMVVSDWDQAATKAIASSKAAQIRGERAGEPSVYSCPECGGVLWQMDEGEVLILRCHVGHIYNAETMLAIQTEIAEAALWVAARILADQGVLNRQLAARERERGSDATVTHFEKAAGTAENRSEVVQDLLQSGAALSVRQAEAEQAQTRDQ